MSCRSPAGNLASSLRITGGFRVCNGLEVVVRLSFPLIGRVAITCGPSQLLAAHPGELLRWKA